MPPPRTSERVRVEAVPRRWLRRSVVSPRWTTERAVSRGADLRSRVVEPTRVPSKDKIGIVASSERMRALVEVVVMRATWGGGLWVVLQRRLAGWWWEEERKIEEEKNEMEEDGVGVADIFFFSSEGLRVFVWECACVLSATSFWLAYPLLQFR